MVPANGRAEMGGHFPGLVLTLWVHGVGRGVVKGFSFVSRQQGHVVENDQDAGATQTKHTEL